MSIAYPPHRLHTSKRVPPTHALSLLSAYLEATATDPSLHPNALHTDNGPIAPSAGANTGLVLHNLRRVEAGLRGEWLGPDVIKEFGGEDDSVTLGAGETPIGVTGQGQPSLEMDGEWQDKEEYEREQDVVQGDIGERDNPVDGGFEGDGGGVPKVTATKSRGEVEARRKAKDERRKKGRRVNAQ